MGCKESNQTKTKTYCLSVPLLVHFSFSPTKISVTDFSAPIGATVFKFYVHLQVGKVYCVNGNEGANSHFAFFFQFSFFSSITYIIHMGIFLSKISQQLLELEFLNLV